MEITLSDPEIRVLGALIEKEHATPDYYPMTLNGLLNACNQKSNREPVVSYDDHTVEAALDALRQKGYANKIVGDGRVPKYDEVFARELNLSLQEAAILCLLFLRGPQTAGEIRGRCARIYDFESLDEVQVTIEMLMQREEAPLVVQLPRQPGHGAHRYIHLLGEQTAEDLADGAPRAAVEPPPAAPAHDDALEQEVARLREELQTLRREFEEFKAQF